jgi:hypothetical protein
MIQISSIDFIFKFNGRFKTWLYGGGLEMDV